MYSKEERKAIKQGFWKGFKSEMNKIPSSTGKRINWINYPTKLKILYVRCDADTEKATFSIDIQVKDPGVREIIWEQFLELKVVLEQEIGSSGTWLTEAKNAAGQSINSIRWELEGVNVFQPLDRKKIYSFFKEKLVGFDAFYQEYNEILFTLVK
jgi:hypothetical protein